MSTTDEPSAGDGKEPASAGHPTGETQPHNNEPGQLVDKPMSGEDSPAPADEAGVPEDAGGPTGAPKQT
jgi:hypothetical protein